jgi:hypothetical protein
MKITHHFAIAYIIKDTRKSFTSYQINNKHNTGFPQACFAGIYAGL